MKSRRRRLILFTRYPVPGRTKTRLVPSLGPEGAAVLQRAMTAHGVGTLRPLLARGIELEVRFDGANAMTLRRWLGGRLRYRRQGGGDLGARMQRAFVDAFTAGVEQVVIIGSDCPGLAAKQVVEAFGCLESDDLVLGPAVDGGYYLIGLRKMAPGLFKGIPWGGAGVLAATRERAGALGLTHAGLETLTDVDRPEDLPIWEEAQRRASTLAVVIPTLNEAEHLAATLRAVAAGQPDELIVADGGSEDDTVALAKSLGARVVLAEAGRACQMNAGAAAASSGMLLFLHADTVPPGDYRRRVTSALQRPEVVAGAFRFALGEPVPGRRWIERLVALRCRLFAAPYGDQGLFLRRECFEICGGFPDWPILEDVELVRRLKRLGRLHLDPAPVVTSGRRWRRRGLWRTSWINRRIMFGYHLGQSPERLKRFYD
jgi:rSAM/selenodomain-associated transferase 2/rSAM/selenodomain-associated transferase 1